MPTKVGAGMGSPPHPLPQRVPSLGLMVMVMDLDSKSQILWGGELVINKIGSDEIGRSKAAQIFPGAFQDSGSGVAFASPTLWAHKWVKSVQREWWV